MDQAARVLVSGELNDRFRPTRCHEDLTISFRFLSGLIIPVNENNCRILFSPAAFRFDLRHLGFKFRYDRKWIAFGNSIRIGHRPDPVKQR